MDADLDTLATALYVRIDDTLADRPELRPWRPRVGIAPKLSDAELLTLAVLQVLLGFEHETRWLRHAHEHLRHLFPYLPGQAGYNKRLRRSAPQLAALIRVLGEDTDVWADDTWLIDSTPVECGRSRPTVKRSNLAGWAGYGYCASHSRWFWGLRLHLIATPAGLPVAFALANPKTDERDVAIDLLDTDPMLLAGRHGQVLIADKGYASAELETRLADQGIELIRPARRDERRRPGARQLKPLRQIIESINATLKTQLSLERHGGHSQQGVLVRVLQRLLALTAYDH
ncbi:MAG TPA: IS982 family transposase [Acidimicrobiales bacterium]|nr:IS982 family transposase [Acidimicrobiales bacterium]